MRFAVGGVLLLELLVLLGTYSKSSLPVEREGWMLWMNEVDVIPRIALVVTTAFLLFVRKGVDPAVAPLAAAPRFGPRFVALALAQLASFVALFLLSHWIFERHLAGSSFPAIWIGAWMASAIAAVTFGAFLCTPTGAITGWIRKNGALVFGICCLGLAAWSAGAWVSSDLKHSLRAPTLWATSTLLGLLGHEIQVSPDPFVIHAPNPPPGFTLTVAPECSGFEGIGLALVFMLAYLGVFRRELRFPQAFLLPPLAALIAWFLNAVRLSILMLLAANEDEDWSKLAVAGFHSVAGTLVFCALALGLVGLSRRLHFFRRRVPTIAQGADTASDSTAAHLAPFLLGVAVGMIYQGFEGRLPALDAVRVTLVGGCLFYFWREHDWRWKVALPQALLCGIAAFALWIALPAIFGGPRVSEFESPAGGWTPLSFLVRHFGYIFVFPLAEELAFRQYLMRRLSHRDWFTVTPQRVTMLAWFLSSLAFGLLHSHWIAATIAGSLYGLLYLRRGSLAEAVLAHSLTNALLTAYVASSSAS